MYYNEMDLEYIDDTVASFADYIASNNIIITNENKESVVKTYLDYLLRKNYTEDFKRINKYFSPFLNELKTVIEKLFNDKDPRHYHKSDKCIYVSPSDYLSKDLRVMFWGGGYDYTDEAFNVYINNKIPLENAKIKLIRTIEPYDASYSWNLHIDLNDAVYWSSKENDLKRLYEELKNEL